MSDVDGRVVSVAAAVLTALWTWIAFSATMALFSGRWAVEAILGPVGDPEVRQRLSEEIPGYVGTFVRTATFGNRQSWVFQPNVGGWRLVGEFGGRTLKLVLVALVLALVVAVPLVLVSQLDGAGPVVAALGLLGGVSTLVWWFFVVDFAANPGSHLTPRSLDEMLVPGATLAVPLGLGLARIAGRLDLTDGPRTVRRVLLDGWLYALWLPGALIVVELVFAVNGVFYLWFQSLIQGDFPLFTLVSSVLVAPVVFCAFVRDLGLALTRPTDSAAPTARDTAADGGVGSLLWPLASAVRDSRVTQAAAGAFGLVFVVGFVGSRLVTPPEVWADKRTLQAFELFDALAAATLTAVVGLAVALVVGLGLGLLATRTPLSRHVPRLLDPLSNLPFAVVLGAWYVYLENPDQLVTLLLYGGLGGLAVAPLVARRFEQEVADSHEATAVLSATGLAVTGAALALFTAAALSFLGLGLLDLSFGTRWIKPDSRLWGSVGVLALPAVLLFVLGEGLRRHDPTA